MMNSSSVCCKYHPDAHLIEDYRAGDQICSECGLFVGDRVIDVGSEWRTFTDDSKSRVGAAENLLLDSTDLITCIGPGQDGSSIYHQSTSNNPLLKAIHALADMGDKLNLPRSITDHANILLKTVLDGKHLQGRPHEAIAATCLYIGLEKKEL